MSTSLSAALVDFALTSLYSFRSRDGRRHHARRQRGQEASQAWLVSDSPISAPDPCYRCSLAVVFREDIERIIGNIERYEKYAYIIAFVVNFMAGATVIVYVPGVPVVFALGGIVHYPFLVGIAAGLGEALG